MKFFIVLFALVALASAYEYYPEADEVERYERSAYGGAGKGMTHFDGPHCKSVVVSCAPVVQKVPCHAPAPKPAYEEPAYKPAPKPAYVAPKLAHKPAPKPAYNPAPEY